MADADRHNEFIARTIKTVGKELLEQGTFEEQLVALESLVAGLFSAVIIADPERRNADSYLGALVHGVRARLSTLRTNDRSWLERRRQSGDI